MRQFIYTLTIMSFTLAMNTLALGSEIEVEREIHTEHAASPHSHVHGNAELHIVLDDKQLSVELHSPALNLLGFEHKTHNTAEQAIVQNTRIKLMKPNALFIFNDGECTLSQQRADFSDIDIEASYVYYCAEPDKLYSTTIRLLTVFPNIASLQVQWIIHNQQGMATVDDEHNEIHFR
ncbi:MAG: hypothetical protein ACI910_003102 [Oleispira sp.]|jgi:hypothetical protein